MTYPTKFTLYARGERTMREFCAANQLDTPAMIVKRREQWEFDACAYYRPVKIVICVDKCAAIGFSGMQWSYPGNTVDRTPFGVIAHEIGHHVDRERSERKAAYFGDYSIGVRATSGEPKLTNYCPNDAEWFAEMFRLFITNPDLLRLLRPRTYALIAKDFKPVETRAWDAVLASAPERTIKAVQRKIDAVAPGETA